MLLAVVLLFFTKPEWEKFHRLSLHLSLSLSGLLRAALGKWADETNTNIGVRVIFTF